VDLTHQKEATCGLFVAEFMAERASSGGGGGVAVAVVLGVVLLSAMVVEMVKRAVTWLVDTEQGPP
jgi:hypothetical protein